MKTKSFLMMICLWLSLFSLTMQAQTNQLYLGSRMEVNSHPIPGDADVWVVGEGKSLKFKLANYSASTITRACKVFIVNTNNQQTNVVWEQVVQIAAWQFIYVDVSACSPLVSSAPGNYALHLRADNTNNLNAITMSSPVVQCVGGGSGAVNPHYITIAPAGTHDSGCVDYALNFNKPTATSVWAPGSTQEIRWTDNSNGLVGSYTFLLHNGTATPYTVGTNIGNDGVHNYTLPANAPQNSNYRLEAKSNNGPVIDSFGPYFTVSAGNPPSIPTLHVDSTNLSEVFLSWNLVSGAGQYFLSYCDGTVITSLGANTNHYTVSNLDQATSYQFKILSFSDVTGTAGFGACVTAVTEETLFVDIQLTDLDLPGMMQKGEPVTMSAIVKNYGNVTFDGSVYLSLHDANNNFITDLKSYTGSITPNGSRTLMFSSEAVVSEVGDYRLVVKYINSGATNYEHLVEVGVSIVGMEVVGSHNIEEVGSSNKTYVLHSLINPATSESVTLRSFAVITNTQTQETSIYEMENNLRSNDFVLEHIFSAGEYQIDYVGFYDWAQMKSEVTERSNLPWYSFWGDGDLVNIQEALYIHNMTDYPETPMIANYTSIRFQATTNLGAEAKIRFYNTESGQETILNMEYDSNTGMWYLEKVFLYPVTYDYRFLTQMGDEEVSFPPAGESPLRLSFLPYLTIAPPISQYDFAYAHPVRFSAENNFLDGPNTKVMMDLTFPDGDEQSVVCNHIGNNVFAADISLNQVGFYSHVYTVTTHDGKVLSFEGERFAIEHGSDCLDIVEPGMIKRSTWCPSCVSQNPNNGAPTHIIIHHTVTPNGDNSYSRVQNIRSGHMTLGNPDIGYHYLIGSDGEIFEGLAGGPEKKGAHFSCMNGGTIGISFLGNFSEVAPSEKALKALDLLLEFLCKKYSIAPDETSNHRFFNAGTGTWLTNKNLPNVTGHRIVNDYQDYACSTTQCPGNAFPSVVEQIAPLVNYCSEATQQVAVELSGPIHAEFSAESTSKNGATHVKVQANVSALHSELVLNFRVRLLSAMQLLYLSDVQEGVFVAHLQDASLTFEGDEILTDETYTVLLEYQKEIGGDWYLLNSEVYDNMPRFDLNSSTLSESEEQNELYIFPNPSNGSFVIKGKDGTHYAMQIISPFGEAVMTDNFVGERYIDLDVQSGLYFLQVQNADGRIIKKIIIERR